MTSLFFLLKQLILREEGELKTDKWAVYKYNKFLVLYVKTKNKKYIHNFIYFIRMWIKDIVERIGKEHILLIFYNSNDKTAESRVLGRRYFHFGKHDLVVYGSDLIVPKKVRRWIKENLKR